jgi:hypothetical protein
MNDIEWPMEGTSLITLIKPKTGQTQIFDAGSHIQLAKLTYNEGWIPLNAQGHPYRVINFGGGQMFVDRDRSNQAAPLNVILGGPWSGSQLKALPLFLAQNPGVTGGLQVPTESTEESPSSDNDGLPADYLFEREIEGCRLYSTPDARPYYFFSTAIDSYGNPQEFLDRTDENGGDLQKVAVSPSENQRISEWLGDSKEPLQYEILSEHRSINTVDLDVRTNRKSLLILNEYFRNDWHVVVNGVTKEPFKANLSQIAVLLPTGRNRIHFEYRPELFVWLSHVQKLGFGLVAVVFVVMAMPPSRKGAASR